MSMPEDIFFSQVLGSNMMVLMLYKVFIINKYSNLKMNKYHIYEQEGRGKYSVIFKARRKKRLEFVAIKRMDKARKQKILNEAKILQDLHHHNIIKFYDQMQTKNHMWAVIEYCPGGDLLKLIEQDKSLPENIVKGFAVQIMKGLSYAHSKGVIICDLKAATILVNQYGNVKLGDFGSAQFLIDLIHNKNEKKKGTPCYMAPELFQVGSVYSFASDLWALGCILYELAQGNPPFVSSSLNDIASLAKTGETPKVDFFSSDFNNLLEKLLIKQPQKRITWKQIYNHSWIKSQLHAYDMPRQPQFQEYKKNRSKNTNVQLLRASQQFQGYGEGKKIPANDRRQLFVFEADQYNNNEENETYEKEQFEPPEKQVQYVAKNKVIMSKRPNQSNEIQDSTTINIFMQTLSSKNMPPIQDVIHHQSDNSVKPIIGNKDIQIIQSFSFNKKALGFAYIEPQVLADGIINGQNEAQLKRILDGMTGQQKYNVLGYFESIIQNSDIANYLFKANFIGYYMKLLKGYKQSNLRAKMCEILGLLIRHATAIDPDILKFGIINGFLQALKDKSQKVRRKSMAALGQLLFYGATQVDEKVNEWDLSMNLIHSLLKILKNPGQDEIVRIYCCKSIQNITAQAKEVGLKFAQIDTLIVLINCLISTKNQAFKSSICCTLHHIMQLNMTLRQMFLDKIGFQNLIDTFKNQDTSNKTQQLLIWIILLQFEKSPKSKLTKSLLQDQGLFSSIISLLEINSAVIRGRIFLYIYYVISYNLKKSLNLLQSKLFYIIQRQGKDGAKYETQCLQFVLVVLYQNFQQLLLLVQQDIKKSLKPSTSFQQKKMFYIGIVNHMINSPIFQQLFQKYINIEHLINLLNSFDIKCDNPYFIQIKSIYMQVVQKLLSNSNLTQKLQEHYSNKLMPFLIGKILKSSQNDIRFCCMKYLLYLVNTYMSEENMYDSTILNTTTSKITLLINDHLIPQLDYLLNNQEQQQQAIASMTLKLIAVLFQISHVFIAKFCQTCEINSILKYYNEFSSINVLKAIQLLVHSKYLKDKYIEKILPITQKILKYYVNSNQEIYLEYPLDICKELVKTCPEEYIDKLWEIGVFLQSNEDIVIRQKAENLIQQFIKYKKVSVKGKWDVKSKKALDNYENFLKITGKQYDHAVVDNFKKPASRYK